MPRRSVHRRRSLRCGRYPPGPAPSYPGRDLTGAALRARLHRDWTWLSLREVDQERGDGRDIEKGHAYWQPSNSTLLRRFLRNALTREAAFTSYFQITAPVHY